MPPYRKPLTVERDTEAAFRTAILAGVLSAAPKDRNWAGHYRSSAGSGMADRRRGRSLRTARSSRTPRRPSPHRGARQADGDRALSACLPFTVEGGRPRSRPYDGRWAPNGFAAALDPPHSAASPTVPALVPFETSSSASRAADRAHGGAHGRRCAPRPRRRCVNGLWRPGVNRQGRLYQPSTRLRAPPGGRRRVASLTTKSRKSMPQGDGGAPTPTSGGPGEKPRRESLCGRAAGPGLPDASALWRDLYGGDIMLEARRAAGAKTRRPAPQVEQRTARRRAPTVI